MRYFVHFLLFAIFLPQCGDLNRPYFGTVGGEPDPSISSPDIPIFPHPEDWNESHRVWARANGTELCLKCHTRKGSNDPNALPGCFSCHPTFPHTEGWKGPEGSPQPHAQAVYNGTIEDCTPCHAVEKGGLPTRNPSCRDCHTFPYPHPEGWAAAPGNPEPHGEEVLANSTASCARSSCHGNGSAIVPTAGNHGPSCATGGCHGGVYPHAANMRSGEVHGPPAVLNISNCKSCHGTGLNQAPAGVQSCTDCHSSLPLHDFAGVTDESWEGVHGAWVTADYDARLNQCKLCHGEDLRGGLSRVNCFSCHDHMGDFPAGWMAEDNPLHALNFISQMKTGSTSTCQKCHGENYDRPVGPDQISCVTCHTGGVTHVSSSVAAWDTGVGHGDSFSSQFRADDKTADCWGCHGSPVSYQDVYVSTPPVDTAAKLSAEREYLAGQSSCYRCHEAYPHVYYPNPLYESRWILGHWAFLASSPLLTDEEGNRAPDGLDHAQDELRIRALDRTCGGSQEGSCHKNGNRSFRHGNRAEGLCGLYCHSPLRPWKPKWRDTAPPAEGSVHPGPPTVVSTTPVAGAADVPVIIEGSTRGGPIDVYFSEAMDASTVTAPGTFTLKKVSDGSLVDAQNIVCNNDGSVWCGRATLTPTVRLDFSTRYRVTVTSAAKDWGGEAMTTDTSWEFTTAAPDTTPPLVISTNPASGEAGVPLATRVITVTFNEPLTSLSPITVNSGNCATAVMCFKWGTSVIPGSVACDVSSGATDCRTIRFKRIGINNLLTEATYSVFVRGVSDLTGNLMVGTHTFNFTTAPPAGE